jgi:hypothetical protein
LEYDELYERADGLRYMLEKIVNFRGTPDDAEDLRKEASKLLITSAEPSNAKAER